MFRCSISDSATSMKSGLSSGSSEDPKSESHDLLEDGHAEFAVGVSGVDTYRSCRTRTMTDAQGVALHRSDDT